MACWRGLLARLSTVQVKWVPNLAALPLIDLRLCVAMSAHIAEQIEQLVTLEQLWIFGRLVPPHKLVSELTEILLLDCTFHATLIKPVPFPCL